MTLGLNSTIGDGTVGWGSAVNTNFATIDAAFPVSIANGGTGLTSIGTNNQVLTSNGTSAFWASPSGGGTTFDDSTFDVFNHSDNTKIIKLSAASIATGTTRTLTAPNVSGTLFTSGGQNAYTTGLGAINQLVGPTDVDFSIVAGAANTVTSVGNGAKLTAGVGGATSGAGGDSALNGGAGTASSAAGGGSFATGGRGGATGVGGGFFGSGGQGGATSGNGGVASVSGGSATSGVGGAVTITAGASGGTNQNAGGTTIDGGASTGTGTSTITFKAAPVGSSGSGSNGSVSVMTLNTNGVSSYRNVATTGWGIPAIYGYKRNTGTQNAAITIASYTVGAADGSFDVSAYVFITISGAYSFNVTCTYTDEGGTSRVVTLPFTQTSGTFSTAAITAAGAPYISQPIRIRAKASTTISVATVGTFTTIQYNTEAAITQMA